MHDKKANLDNLRLTSAAKNIIKSINDIRDHNFLAQNLSRVHVPSQSKIAKKYVAKRNQHNSRVANQWLRKLVSKLHKKINLHGLKLSSAAKGIISKIDSVNDHNILAKGLALTPPLLQLNLAKEYAKKYNKNETKADLHANEWFKKTIAKLKPRFGLLFMLTQTPPLPLYIIKDLKKTKDYGFTAAKECLEIILSISNADIENPSKNADILTQQKIEHAYYAVGQHAQTLNVKLQYWDSRESGLTNEQMEIALMKAKCERWWARKLKTVRAQYLEHVEIATGNVGRDKYKASQTNEIKRKGISPYSSYQAQSEYITAQRSGRKYLSNLELENDKGQVIDLITAVDAGMANPENRRNELMLRIRETEELANEMGYVGVFYTMTCPSKYHPNSDNWNGASPKEAQAYLVKTWARARAKLNRLGINYFGVRVAEPHADGCPHWHMMLFMAKNQVQTVNAITRKYFIEEDTEELYKRYGHTTTKLKNKLTATPTTNGVKYTYTEFTKTSRTNDNRKILFKTYKQKRQTWGYKKKQGIKAKAPEKFYRTFAPRFTAINIDPKKGSAAGYIAKYISKNIDGFKVSDHEDAETGDLIKVNPVLAWASTWSIKQFQFQGSPSVTVYRELRRQREPVQHQDLERVRFAADNANWKEFVKLMGGMCIGRNANFKTAYQTTPFGNDYGEAVKRIKGIFTNADYTAQAIRQLKAEFSVETNASLITRDTQWTKQQKGTAAANAQGINTHQAGQNAEERGLSWTSGNNCTPLHTPTKAEYTLGQLGLSQNEINTLKKGCKVLSNGSLYQLINNQLVIFEPNKQIENRKKEETRHLAQCYARKAGRSVPNNYDFAQAKELVNLAFTQAINNQRKAPNENDWITAQQMADGEIEQSWWD